MITILQGDVVEQLRTLSDQSVHCVVTSPPYWGLRDYGTAEWEGGDAGCDHVGSIPRTVSGGEGKQYTNTGSNRVFSGDCGKCGAKRIDQQIGLEKTPEEYVDKMVGVFREVKRVLRDDGTCWLNMGDCYNGSGGAGGDYAAGGLREGEPKYKGRNTAALKPKDLVGIPWRVAFALQKDGWYLRSDIIWSKPNPMPESVTDRPTKSHEYIFLLTKKARYFYDADAIREPHVTQENRPDGIIRNRLFAYDSKENILRPKNLERTDPHTMHRAREMARDGTNIPGHSGNYNAQGECILNPAGRNRRTVWEIATQPFPEAHFATFPEALVEPCIKAGTSERGCCSKCGAPWERMTEKELMQYCERGNYVWGIKPEDPPARQFQHSPVGWKKKTIKEWWQPTCQCGAEDTVPCTVLDPFMGSGTTLKVARDLKRDVIGIELNPAYIRIARERLRLNEQLIGVI